jgi:hypothetical protein
MENQKAITAKLYKFKTLIDNELTRNAKRTAAENLTIWGDITDRVGHFAALHFRKALEQPKLPKSVWGRVKWAWKGEVSPPQYNYGETVMKLIYDCAKSQFLTWQSANEGSEATIKYMLKTDTAFFRMERAQSLIEERETARLIDRKVKEVDVIVRLKKNIVPTKKAKL